jgi:hypothetical protein
MSVDSGRVLFAYRVFVCVQTCPITRRLAQRLIFLYDLPPYATTSHDPKAHLDLFTATYNYYCMLYADLDLVLLLSL